MPVNKWLIVGRWGSTTNILPSYHFLTHTDLSLGSNCNRLFYNHHYTYILHNCRWSLCTGKIHCNHDSTEVATHKWTVHGASWKVCTYVVSASNRTKGSKPIRAWTPPSLKHSIPFEATGQSLHSQVDPWDPWQPVKERNTSQEHVTKCKVCLAILNMYLHYPLRLTTHRQAFTLPTNAAPFTRAYLPIRWAAPETTGGSCKHIQSIMLHFQSLQASFHTHVQITVLR